jgi:hypothetical protein
MVYSGEKTSTGIKDFRWGWVYLKLSSNNTTNKVGDYRVMRDENNLARPTTWIPYLIFRYCLQANLQWWKYNVGTRHAVSFFLFVCGVCCGVLKFPFYQSALALLISVEFSERKMTGYVLLKLHLQRKCNNIK